MRRLFTFLLLALTILPASAMAHVGDVTNDTVIALLRAGLSDEAIIAVVDRPRTDFDVEPEALIRLREVGLSNAVIVAIIAAEKRARPAETPSVAVPSVAVELPVASFELMFWDSIKHSTSVADYEAYLLQYPYGHFTTLAVARLETLQKQQEGRKAAELAMLQATPKPVPEPVIVPAEPPPPVISEQALKQNGEFERALSDYLEIQFGIEFDNFETLKIRKISRQILMVDIEYFYSASDMSQRLGHASTNVQKTGSSYKIIAFESLFPSASQLRKFGRSEAGGSY